MKRHFIAVAFAMSAATPVLAFEGDWGFDNGSGREFLWLGDNVEGGDLHLLGTDRYCGSPGDSYGWMHEVLNENGTSGEQIAWWIDQSCTDGYVRVCVQNRFGDVGCSSYEHGGWD